MSDLLLSDGFYATAQRFLWHAASGTAVLADVHLGIETTLAGQGMAVPPVHLPGLRRAWRGVCDRLASSPGGKRRVVIAGDFFDSAMPDGGAVGLARELIGELPGGTVVTIVVGNHDPSPTILGEMFVELCVEIAEASRVGEYTVIHGHSFKETGDAKGLIVGHQHPSVVLRNRVESAKMICFASGRVRRKGGSIRMLILPTFSEAPLGSNLMTKAHWILDVPREEVGDIRIAGIVERGGGQVLDFGLLADLEGKAGVP